MSNEKERTFEEVIADTNAAIDNIIASAKYWKERCLAAEGFISKSPCDPDITKEQIIAHDYWQLLKKQTL